MEQRVAYCRFWQRKLADNKEVEFPDKLCRAVAEITHGFSFAYIQEAFVAALLAIARDSDDAGGWGLVDEALGEIENGWVGVAASASTKGGEDDDLEGLVLWVEIKKQVAILREGMEKKPGQDV